MNGTSTAGKYSSGNRRAETTPMATSDTNTMMMVTGLRSANSAGDMVGRLAPGTLAGLHGAGLPEPCLGSVAAAARIGCMNVRPAVEHSDT